MEETLTYREQLRDLVRREARPAHKYGHQARLYDLTQEIGKGVDYDDDVVFAAVWLHDLGVFDGNRPSDPAELQRWDHVSYAVRRSAEILPGTGFPGEKIAHVLSVIEQHQPGDDPVSLEATIVRDADILEQMGAIAVLRTAAKLGGDTRFVQFRDVTRYLQGRVTELPGKLRLSRSRTLAAPREKALEEFLLRLEEEAGRELGEDEVA